MLNGKEDKLTLLSCELGLIKSDFVSSIHPKETVES